MKNLFKKKSEKKFQPANDKTDAFDNLLKTETNEKNFNKESEFNLKKQVAENVQETLNDTDRLDKPLDKESEETKKPLKEIILPPDEPSLHEHFMESKSKEETNSNDNSVNEALDKTEESTSSNDKSQVSSFSGTKDPKKFLDSVLDDKKALISEKEDTETEKTPVETPAKVEHKSANLTEVEAFVADWFENDIPGADLNDRILSAIHMIASPKLKDDTNDSGKNFVYKKLLDYFRSNGRNLINAINNYTEDAAGKPSWTVIHQQEYDNMLLLSLVNPKDYEVVSKIPAVCRLIERIQRGELVLVKNPKIKH